MLKRKISMTRVNEERERDQKIDVEPTQHHRNLMYYSYGCVNVLFITIFVEVYEINDGMFAYFSGSRRENSSARECQSVKLIFWCFVFGEREYSYFRSFFELWASTSGWRE